MRCVESLNLALHRSLETDPRVYVVGEDVLDPYGGAFKVTRGLSTQFPDRVLTTPISEAGIVGFAAGMALKGLVPVVEIMFGDFVTLALDQLLNNVTKFGPMWGRPSAAHIVVRAPMGGYRGYGATHSQSLEKLLVGIPHLTVVAPSHVHDVGVLLERAIAEEQGPVVFVENKLLYALECEAGAEQIGMFSVDASSGRFPSIRLSPTSFEHADVTLVAYGGMLPLVLDATLAALLEHEIAAEVVVPSLLAPLDLDPIVASVRRTRRLVTVEEGTRANGIGAEIVARVVESEAGLVTDTARRVTAADSVIPSARQLERSVLPSKEDVVEALRGVVSHAAVR